MSTKEDFSRVTKLLDEETWGFLQSLNDTLIMKMELENWQLSLIQGLPSEGIQCLTQSWLQDESDPTLEPHCNATWAGNFCWPRVLVNQTQRLFSCTALLQDSTDYTNDSIWNNLTETAHRTCSSDGHWYWGNESDFSSCAPSIRDQSALPAINYRRLVAYILFFGSSISLTSLILAITIFFYFRNLSCDRIKLHVHFMVALALKCVTFIIISEQQVFGGRRRHFRVDWSCKLVIATSLYTYLASINWMFVQGHYLNSKLTTRVFNRDCPTMAYTIFGWVVPLVPLLVWAVLMENYWGTKCWRGYTDSLLIWILLGPLLAVLLVNLFFLTNILRVLLNKIQLTSNDTEGRRFVRAFKATIVLFPLLGLNILLLFYNPGGEYLPYYMVVNAVMHSSHGFFVALFYCFICPDVINAIRREYRKRISTRRFPSQSFSRSRTGLTSQHQSSSTSRSRSSSRTLNTYTTVETRGGNVTASAPSFILTAV